MHRHALTALATLSVVTAIVASHGNDTQAISTPVPAGPGPSLTAKLATPSTPAVARKRNLRPRGASPSLLRAYTRYYWAARHRFGRRRVGRNIRKYGVRYRWHRGIYMVRRARASEIRRSLAKLKRMLHPPHPKTAAVAWNVRTITGLGWKLRAMGYRVGEHPLFGGVAPVHVINSRHYRAQAIDVNCDGCPGGELAAIDRIVGWVRSLGFTVIWRAPGHWNHLHVQH